MDDLRRELQQLRKFPLASATTIAFVPEADLCTLLTKGRLIEALSDPAFGLQAHQIEPVANETFENARKILAILVELRLEAKLKSCLERSLSDTSLPIKDSSRLLNLFPESVSHFERLQWEYVPLRFREHLHKEIDREQILPYVENKTLKSGGFSSVFKVRIHPEYQNWTKTFDPVGVLAVRKEISPRTSDEAQRRESDLLFLLRSLRNDNIVQLLTSYTQNNFCNLLFPVADCDLHDLLLNPDRPDWVIDPLQLFHSLTGLANGLDHLHNFRPLAQSGVEAENITKHGYHHDIKPRNVLVSGTRLILSDFGLSRLKNLDEDTRTLWKNTPPTYGAPEARDPESLVARHIGRAYDIWSFGCILSELATYALEGTFGVKLFRRQRRVDGIYGSHNCFHHKGEISPKVLAWHSALGDRYNAHPSLGLLDLSRSLLDSNPDRRPKSKDIIRRLVRISFKQLVTDALRLISQIQNNWQDKSGSVTYLTKIDIEKNRLQAWGHALGIIPFNSHWKAMGDHAFQEYHRQIGVLESLNVQVLPLSEANDDNIDSQQWALRILSEANDSLLLGLPSDVKVVIDNTFQLMMVSNARMSTILPVLDEDFPEFTGPSENIVADPDNTAEHETQLLVAARSMAIMISSKDNESLKQMATVLDPLLITEDPSHPTPYGALSICRFQYSFQATAVMRVLVEERLYAGKWATLPSDWEVADIGFEIFKRIHELALLFQMQPKPKTFRILNCLGVYHLPAVAKFGFVYAFPRLQEGHENSYPVTLSQLISGTKSPEQIPTLNDKFALAKNLVSCINSLHLTGWLHKAITSHNFVFFMSANQAMTDVAMTEPYLTGFEHSRQSARSAYSEGNAAPTIFTHPSYTGAQRYHLAFDYYSLGLVLLEIALWRPLAKVLKSKSDEFPTRQDANYDAVRYVPQRMGIGYTEAVLACLDFYEKHKDTEEETELLLYFQEEVLEKLQRTSLPV